MKINWFSPLPPARSDIANFTARVLPELAKMAEVSLFTPTPDANRQLQRLASVHHIDNNFRDWRTLNSADHTFYNFGNDARFHGAIARIAAQHPGIAILHEPNLHELYLGTYRSPGERELHYLPRLLAYYGEECLVQGRAVIEGKRKPSELAPDAPLLEWPLERARAVVVHDPALLTLVRRISSAPAVAVNLPYASLADLPQPVPMPLTRNPEGPLQLVLFGFLHGTNRRLMPFLEALASFPQKERCRLTLAGEIPNPAQIRSFLQEKGLQRITRLQGFLSEKALSQLLDASDLAINLRYPSLGESSGSLLRIWSHARPCLVTRTAWYARRPPDTVAFVNPDNEKADIHQHLATALKQPHAYAAIGNAGRLELERQHATSAYASAIKALLNELNSHRFHSFAVPYLQSLASHSAKIPTLWDNRAASLAIQLLSCLPPTPNNS